MPQHGSVPKPVLIIEDVQTACTVLRNHDYVPDRITHNELMSGSGEHYHGKLKNGDYALLWIASPGDWFVRTPGKRGDPHWKRINSMVKTACALQMILIIFGPPGFLWRLPNFQETATDMGLQSQRMRLCHFGIKYDQKLVNPSGSYLQVMSNKPLDMRAYGCKCNVGIDQHMLDWYGRTQEQAEWRRKTMLSICSSFCRQFFRGIQDSKTPPSPTGPATAYPTEARLRQKERLKKDKAAGIKPKKRKKIIEEGNDDCGDDISGLGRDAVLLSRDIIPEDVEESDSEMFHLIPSSLDDGTCKDVFCALVSLCYGKHNTVDLIELCGGAGRISQVAFRRKLESGGNLDLTTQCDLGDPTTQEAIDHYLNVCYVLVTILQPNCRTVGRPSYFNAKVNFNTWHDHHQQDLPHLKYCGMVALTQMRLDRYFLRELPVGNWIDDIIPWTLVVKDDSVVKQHSDQCMSGARDEWNQPVKKPTEWTSNSQTLVKPMHKFQCNGLHEHGHPTSKSLEKLKTYTWKLCEAVIDGVEDLKRQHGSMPTHGNVLSYPTSEAGTSTDETSTIPPRAPTGGRGCPACHSGWRADSPGHTRKAGTCRWFDVTAKHWECPACEANNTGRNNALHTPYRNDPTKCRFGIDPSDAAPSRTGAHPREPRPTAVMHPSAEASANDVDLEEVAPDVPDARPHGEHDPTARSSTEPDPGDAVPRGVRGPDTVDRTRRTYADVGSGATKMPDWTRFNIQISLRNLRSWNPAVISKELRTLHLRWWHAKEPKMRHILHSAGVDSIRLDLIKGVVDTCRECRAWQKPGNTIMASVSLPTKFNEEGECDLMFYKRHIAFHIIDRTIRYADGCEVENKETRTLLDAYTTTWYQRHGPFKVLYSDGEKGLANDMAKAELRRLGTELRIRAPKQHASMIESRNAFLRTVMHLIEADLKRFSIVIAFKRLLGEGLFVSNAFTFFNGVSPYNCLTGRQPACLPDLENIDFPKEGENTDGNREQRVREAGMQAVTQATAVAKINRALKTKTSIDGSKLFKPGDLIDYHRTTPVKDEHGGWNGPFAVLRNEPERGKLVCNVGGKEVDVHYPNARLTLYVEALIVKELSSENEAMQTILHHISMMQPGKLQTFGYVSVATRGSVQQGNVLRLSTTSVNIPRVHLALQFVIKNFFRISDVIAVRLGRNIHKAGVFSIADGSTLIHYTSDVDPHFHFYESKETSMNFHDIAGSKARIIQCLTKYGSDTNICDPSEEAQGLITPSDGYADPASAEVEPSGPEHFDIDDDRLSTIHEDPDENEVDIVMESFYQELTNNDALVDDPNHDDSVSQPVYMVPEGTVLVTATDEVRQTFYGETERESTQHGHMPQEHGNVPNDVLISITNGEVEDMKLSTEHDETGEYVELCFEESMANVILDEDQYVSNGEVATLRVYLTSAANKKAVVVKDDDLLTKAEMYTNTKEVASAIVTELNIWLQNQCFERCDIRDAQNVMTSRYVCKWKWIQSPQGTSKKVIRMRLVLRGFMDLEAFSLDTFAGTAKRTSQKILASEAACNESFILASLDIDKAFLKGFTYKELAEATGEKERVVCFKLPSGSAEVLRTIKGFETFDETKHCLRCIKPGTGTKDAPRAFSLKLRRTTKDIGLKSTSFDAEFEVKKGLLTAKHVDDINMTGVEREIDQYVKRVEATFGQCKVNKHTFTNCGVRYTKTKEGDVVMDQDEYIKTLRPIMTSELTGAAAESNATFNVTSQFVSLRGALAYAVLTQVWIQVYVVSLQRVQQPTNLDVRRLNAVTRKLQKEPQKLTFPSMVCSGHLDLHTDAGYRRLTGEDDEQKGYGMRGLNVLRRGIARRRAPTSTDTCPNRKVSAVHLIDSACKSHRLQIRSSYSAETLAATHGLEDAYPTMITLHELRHGILSPEELKNLREIGGLGIRVTLTIDAESVYKSLSSRDLKIPTEKSLLGHVSWVRELLAAGIVDNIQWCDTRDMTADGHTKGSIDRAGLIEVMSGRQRYSHDTKEYRPYRPPKATTTNSEARPWIRARTPEKATKRVCFVLGL